VLHGAEGKLEVGCDLAGVAVTERVGEKQDAGASLPEQPVKHGASLPNYPVNRPKK
jgi:hypothetical protein